MKNHFETLASYLPFSLLEPVNFLLAAVVVTFIVAVRYFLIVGAAWIYLYSSTPASWKSRQIYEKLPGRDIQVFEIKTSLVSSAIFGVSGALLGVLWELGWARFYLKFDAYGLSYLFLSILLIAVLHEIYFYLTHRLLHEPWAFRRFHAVHHKSLEPSPWASFSFHPVEAVIQAAAIPLIVLIVPVHPVVLIAYLSLMTFSAIINHLGFEILPKGPIGSHMAKWLITGTHHARHHRFYKSNFGLYFTVCDRIFGTEYVAKAASRVTATFAGTPTSSGSSQ